jgi:hypothetical protein
MLHYCTKAVKSTLAPSSQLYPISTSLGLQSRTELLLLISSPLLQTRMSVPSVMDTRTEFHGRLTILPEDGNKAQRQSDLERASAFLKQTARCGCLGKNGPVVLTGQSRLRVYQSQFMKFARNIGTVMTFEPRSRPLTYPIRIHQQILICLHRGFLRLRNHYFPAVSTIFANAILAIVVGSVFYNLSSTTDSMDRRAILIFFSLMICAFSPAFEVTPSKFPATTSHRNQVFNVKFFVGSYYVGTAAHHRETRSIRIVPSFR